MSKSLSLTVHLRKESRVVAHVNPNGPGMTRIEPVDAGRIRVDATARLDSNGVRVDATVALTRVRTGPG
jgi:hypothetical protein